MTGPHYSVAGWYSGDECDPPEYHKEWLTITEDDEEYAIIVLRTDASIFLDDPGALEVARRVRERRAVRIVKALNDTEALHGKDVA